MTNMERKTFCAALSRYGAQAQITMAFEEMAELQDVLCKFLRGHVVKVERAEEYQQMTMGTAKSKRNE